MQDINSFKEKLDNTYDWPSNYHYKFIVPSSPEKIEAVKALFRAKTPINLKKSSNGKYTSISAKQLENNSDDVMDTYIKATNIQGLISL